MTPLHFQVRDSLDVYAPRRAVMDLASGQRFARNDAQELAIVVSELISNILKYGVRGSVRFELAEHPDWGAGIRITAEDEGPPFHDLTLALRDGFSDRGPIDPVTLYKRGGLGTGLGAIVRLTDGFEVETREHGKSIRVVRYRRRPGTGSGSRR